MIVPELHIQEIIGLIPTYTLDEDTDRQSLPLTYGFGDHKTLLQELKQRRLNQSPLYPLVWFVMPFDEGHYETAVEVDEITLILAINTRKEWLNPQRYRETFQTYLFPNLELIKQALLKANTFSIFPLTQTAGRNKYFSVVKRPNYGDPEELDKFDTSQTRNKATENKATDYWDAIQITFKGRFKETCLLPIIFNIQNLTQWQY